MVFDRPIEEAIINNSVNTSAVLIIAEIKVSNKDKPSAINNQLIPAMKFCENNPYGIYWDVATRFIDIKLFILPIITQALSNRVSDSLHSGKLFALDAFSASYSKADQSGDIWSTWIESSWSQLSGNPVVGSDTLEYRGSSFDIHAGVDKAFSDSMRAGVAVGINRAELDVDFASNGILDDKAVRNLNSLLPYIRWSDNKLDAHILFSGGYGIGELEIEQAGNGCRSDIDLDWMMANISGGYRVDLTEKWDLSFSGGGNITHSNLGSGLCASGGGIGALEESSGEGSLGVKTSWLEPLAYMRGTLHPYLSADARMASGDAEDDVAYNLGGGLEVSLPLYRLLLSIEGNRQLNEIEHNYDSISGGISFRRGRYATSLGSSYNISDGIEKISHRLELNYQSEWGLNTINSGIYIERAIGGTSTTDSAGLYVEVEWE